MQDGSGDAAAEEHAGPPRPLYRRLPRGPHQLGKRAVARNQRVRIHGAMVRALAAEGYDGVSVRLLIALAGVSRRSFYEQFAGKQDCFLRPSTRSPSSTWQSCAGPARSPRVGATGGWRRRSERMPPRSRAIAMRPPWYCCIRSRPARPVRSACARPARRGNSSSAPRLAGSALLPSPAYAEATLGGMQGMLSARLREPSLGSRRLLARETLAGGAGPQVASPEPDARRVASLLRDDARRASQASPGPPAERPRGDCQRLLGATLRLAARERVALLSAAQICDEARGAAPGVLRAVLRPRRRGGAAIADAGERLIAIAGGAGEES